MRSRTRVLEAATALLADLYAAGMRHGISPEDWSWVSSLGQDCIDAIKQRTLQQQQAQDKSLPPRAGRPTRGPRPARPPDPVSTFLTALEVIARYGWGRTKGYRMLRSAGSPRPIGGDRYRLDTLIAWENAQLAAAPPSKPVPSFPARKRVRAS